MNRPIREGFFRTVAEANKAVTRLLLAGFSKDQLAIICPDHLKSLLSHDLPDAQRPGSNAPQAIIAGGAVGATLGGIALTATALATGGVGLVAAIPVLIGGGAIAGGFSALIVTDGYGKEIGQHYEEAIRLGDIVVGVKVEENDSAQKLAQAEAILSEAGGRFPSTMKEQV